LPPESAAWAWTAANHAMAVAKKKVTVLGMLGMRIMADFSSI
jgi:hypothetical protein